MKQGWPCTNFGCGGHATTPTGVCSECQRAVNRINEIAKAHIESRSVSELIVDHAIKKREEAKESTANKYPKYYRNVSNLDHIDVYQVHKLFGVDDSSGAIQHASKKLLLSGMRTGNKTKYQDIKEARDTLNRWLEMNEE